jgi:hypothetical protein
MTGPYASYETGVLGLTTEEAPSGQQTLTEDPCSAVAARFEGGGAWPGGGPTSAASVRAQGARDEVFSEDVNRAASPVSLAAKHQLAPKIGETVTIPAAARTDGPSGPFTPPPKTTNRTRLLACRVDALVVAFKVAVEPAVNDELDERQSIADLAGAAELKAGAARFAVKRSRSRDSFVLENADVRLVVDRCARGGWNVEVTIRAVYLATHSLADAIAMPRRLAASLGAVADARLRRFDLSGDFVGFELAPGDIERLQTTRSKAEQFAVQDKDVAEVGTPLGRSLREYRDAALRVTGFAVSPGNPMMARIYDKTAELRLPGREAKRDIEEARWRANGWEGVQTVVRVEFQHRGAFLDEIKLRDPQRLESAVDAVWQRDVQWLSLIDPTSATRRSRCALDPRWEVVTATVFNHIASPIARSREFRGGAKPEHVLGNAVSRLASTGTLDRLGFDVTEDGEVLNERSFVQMSPEKARAWIEETLGKLAAALPSDLARHLLGRTEPREAALSLFCKLRASSARFSSADDAEGAVSASRKLRRRQQRSDPVIRISVPLPADIQPWEYDLLVPHLQTILRAVLEEPQARDDDEQGET